MAVLTSNLMRIVRVHAGHKTYDWYGFLIYKTFVALLGNDALTPYDPDLGVGTSRGQITVEDSTYCVFLNAAGVYVVYSNMVSVVMLLQSIGQARRAREERQVTRDKVMRHMKLSTELKTRVREMYPESTALCPET